MNKHLFDILLVNEEFLAGVELDAELAGIGIGDAAPRGRGESPAMQQPHFLRGQPCLLLG